MSSVISELVICDTTFRDGSQVSGAEPVSLERAKEAIAEIEKLDLGDKLIMELGFAHPKNKGDLARIKEALSSGVTNVTSFSRLHHMDIKTVVSLNKDHGLTGASLVGESRREDVKRIKKTLSGQLVDIESYISRLTSRGMNVYYDAQHFFAAFREGDINDEKYALQCVQKASEAGAKWIVLCDTDGATPPHMVKPIIEKAAEAAGGIKKIGVHFHDRLPFAFANTLAAYEAGVRHIQGVWGKGLGDSGGNLDLITFIGTMYSSYGEQFVDKRKMKGFVNVYQSVCRALNLAPDPAARFVSDVVVPAGMHAHGIAENPKSYLPYDPRDFGAKIVFGLGSLAGGTNALEHATRELGIKIPPDDRERISKAFSKKLEEGVVFDGAHASFHVWILKLLGRLKDPFKVESIRTIYEKGDCQRPKSDACLCISEENGSHSLMQVGDGQVNAMEKVLREAWYRTRKDIRSRLKRICFCGYHHEVITKEAGSDAKVRVYCLFEDGKRQWKSIGVDKDTSEASWKALMDAYLYGMLVIDE